MNAIQLDGVRKIRKKKKITHAIIIIIVIVAVTVVVVVFAANVRRMCVNDDGVVDNLLKEENL